MSILDPRVWLAAILALVLAYGGGRLQQRFVDDRRYEAEKTAALAKAQAQRIRDVDAARIEEQRRTDEQRKIADDATKKADVARADAAAANDAAGRLRLRVAELLAARRSAKDPSTSSPSQAAGNADDLLALLLEKSVRRATDLAAYADQARIAGMACERAYDSLSSGQAPGAD